MVSKKGSESNGKAVCVEAYIQMKHQVHEINQKPAMITEDVLLEDIHVVIGVLCSYLTN